MNNVPGGEAAILRPKCPPYDQVPEQHMEASPETRQHRFEKVVGDSKQQAAPSPKQCDDAEDDENDLRSDERPNALRLSAALLRHDELLELAHKYRAHRPANLRPKTRHR